MEYNFSQNIPSKAFVYKNYTIYYKTFLLYYTFMFLAAYVYWKFKRIKHHKFHLNKKNTKYKYIL